MSYHAPGGSSAASLVVPDQVPAAGNHGIPPSGAEPHEQPAGATPRRFLAKAWPRFRRLTELGFPRRFPIVQFPNAPLIIAFLAGQAAVHAHGSSHDYAASVSYSAMTVWAYEELVHGVNWFRHLLGLAYVVIVAMRVAMALHGA